jgi:hypothetical protein
MIFLENIAEKVLVVIERTKFDVDQRRGILRIDTKKEVLRIPIS